VHAFVLEARFTELLGVVLGVHRLFARSKVVVIHSQFGTMLENEFIHVNVDLGVDECCAGLTQAFVGLYLGKKATQPFE
jgi:hypothetical protein